MDELVCSFCGKGQNEVNQLIYSAEAYICDGCVMVCYGVIQQRTRELAHEETSKQRFMEFWGTD